MILQSILWAPEVGKLNFKTMSKKTIGFTLIELLVVISIIGILASIVSVSVMSAKVTARDTKRKADLKTMQDALESYYYKSQKYPTGIAWSVGDYALLTDALVPTYLASVPKDPTNKAGAPPGASSQSYLGDGPPYDLGYYYYSLDGSSYMLGTNLEKSSKNTEDATCHCGNYRLTGGDAPVCSSTNNCNLLPLP